MDLLCRTTRRMGLEVFGYECDIADHVGRRVELIEDCELRPFAMKTALRDLLQDASLSDQRTVDAVALNLLVTGEASPQLSSALKAQVAVPWGRIAGLRRRIAHGYFGLSPVRLWLTASEDAPVLRRLVTIWRKAR